MSDKRLQGIGNEETGVSRRTFVKAAGASGAAVGLAGCIYGGGDGDGGDEVVIAMGSTTIEDVENAMPDLLYENGLDENIDIRFSSQSDDSGEQRDTYVSLIEAEEAEPDLMMADTGWTNVLIERGLLENLSEQLDDETLSLIDEDYFAAFTDTARGQDGDLYGLPLFPDYAVMFYNKNYAREAGYSDDDFEQWATEAMTWQEWAETTEEIVEASDAEFGFATQWDIYEGTACCTWNEVMTSWGGAYFGGEENLNGPVGDRPVTAGEEESTEALRMMYTFAAQEEDSEIHEDYPTGIASSDITSWDEEPAREPFSSGQAAMLRNWPYTVPTTLGGEDYPFEDEEDLGAMPLPYAVEEGEGEYPGTGGTTSAQGGWHIALNPHSERKDAAQQVMQAMTEDDFNLGMLEVIAWLPPKPDLFEAEEATDPDAVGDIAHYLETLRIAGEGAMPRPVTEVWPNQVDIIAEQVNQAVAGDKAPDQATADMQSGLEDSES